MRHVMFALLLVVATPAFAQQERSFDLKVTEAQLNIIGKALGKLPFEEVAQLIQTLNTQVQAQLPKDGEKKQAPPVEEQKK